ncbi:septum site-determining protein MinC [Desulfosalsimonas propionicica]|uniref:Probable septum site-determining protein MinC n=1 Tax=Desulfosalsimonas propionicica TaxID=332175 RepID=A0A7W0HLQ6_9BACT|nr:septum site-determining protein MinC [Desulfosalsimonas propionicica]MBA2882574.1 septum site-determining protein MinC [Desulfosalsimonas propionicica]
MTIQQPPVKLKGVGDSLWITMDASLPAETLKQELCKPFERLRHLAVNARVVLDPGESQADDALIEDLGAFLQQRFQVGRVSGPPKAKITPAADGQKAADSGRNAQNAWLHHSDDTLVIAGRVRSGQKVEARKHLVILGDLNPGAEAIAGGDIIILGSLLGTAAAGQPANENAIVLGLDLRPTQIQIAGYVAAGTSSSSGKKPEFASLKDNQIVMADYLKDNIFKRLAWPEIR